VDTVIEPFAGTAVASINPPPDRPPPKNIYLNDINCHIANVLRSIMYHPDEVALHAGHPRIELDMHMAHDLVINGREGLRALLGTSLQACDPVMAQSPTGP
jgi:hypothetical protein